MLKGVRGNAVSHAKTFFIAFDEGHDASWSVRRTTMIVRTLPKSTGPTMDFSWLALKVRKVGFVNERTIAKDPDTLFACEVLAALIDAGGIEGHFSLLVHTMDSLRP